MCQAIRPSKWNDPEPRPPRSAAGHAHVAADRGLPAFQDLGAQTNGVQTNLTFFDLAKMLGFEKITITNGRDFAYQVILE